MAHQKNYRPGRKLIVFFLGVVVLYGLTALAGSWTPGLGLDLQGGTRITLIAKGDPTTESLDEARKIIDERVNGSGVNESEVTTQGNRFIVVEIPGEQRRDLEETVKRTAQLRFRIVAGSPVGPATTAPDASPPASPSGDASPTGAASPSGGPTTAGNNRPAPGADDDPTGSPSPSAQPTDDPSATTDLPDDGPLADDPIAWSQSPPPEWQARQLAYQCPGADATTPIVDDPDRPLVTCDDDGNRFLLSKAIIEGTELKDASYGTPPQGVGWAVTLSFKGSARETFADTTRALYANGGQFAIVLDGKVISYAGVNEPILDGNAQITGSFTEAEAKSLSTSLKFGALPIAFEDDPSVETIGPSLAGNQLQAGLLAGAFGLGLVMIYCLLYYRGLGLVVLASLAVAAVITFAMVNLLSVAAGFTLTLPGIAGLVIGVGVTADSFIIFFERIRDEMREGRTMRVAVETGWVRARKTRMAANVVSLLSAAVLYTFATGVVKGFGFALGLSTAIDLAVLFWFTKHAVSWLARFRFFNGGGDLSGLSVSTLGLDAIREGGRR